ncbi:unnamed protein product [marine sediment metagenome]|uniref:Uncharacterized protein n=1 Tax=marine sediment metagenome TaxID=412755 RepID=X1ISN6_9ZZZZ
MVYANVISFTHTATDDLIFRLTSSHMWFREANMHIVTNDALYGDKDLQLGSPYATATGGAMPHHPNI